MLKYLILLVIGLSVQWTLANIDESLQNLNIAGIGELPGNITSKIPSESDLEEALIKKCEAREGPEAGKKVTDAKNEAVQCIKNLVDVKELQEEMEKAKPTGDLDSVFKKYCKKTPEFKKCVSTLTDSLKFCLKDDEKADLSTVLNVTDQLAEFVCYKEGDRIALFIAEGGPECLESHKNSIWECVETVFKKYYKSTDDISLEDIPLLLFRHEQCEDFHKFQTCVVKKLEKCKEPTPANIIDSLFTFVKKATPCSSYKFVDEMAEAIKKSKSTLCSSLSPMLFIIMVILSLSRYLQNDY